jgi:nucleoid-associated protein YgaU
MRAYLLLSDCPDGTTVFTHPHPVGFTGFSGERTAPGAAQTGQTLTYTARPGETLWSIAYNFYGSMREPVIGRIIRANAAYMRANNNTVSAGTVLTLPVEGMRAPANRAHFNRNNVYLVRAGDTLSDIALAMYGDRTLWTVIFEANRGWVRNANLIREGQWLIIP